MLEVVALHLKRHRVTYATIDGSVNPKQRMDLVEAFNSSGGPQVPADHSRAMEVGANRSQLYREDVNIGTQFNIIHDFGISLVAQQVMDLALSLLWCGFDPWPGNFCMLGA